MFRSEATVCLMSINTAPTLCLAAARVGSANANEGYPCAYQYEYCFVGQWAVRQAIDTMNSRTDRNATLIANHPVSLSAQPLSSRHHARDSR